MAKANNVTRLTPATRRRRELTARDRELSGIRIGDAEIKQLRNLHSYLGSYELAKAIGIGPDALHRVMAGLIDSCKGPIRRAVAEFFAANR